MKSLALFGSLLCLALVTPAAAEARPGDNHWRDGNGGRRGGGAPAGQFYRPERPRGGDYGGYPRGRLETYGYAPNRERRFEPPAYRPAPRYAEPPMPMWRPRQDSLGAGWRQQQDEARMGVRQGRFMPLSRVLPQLQRRMPGRQLDAGLEQGWRGQPVYRVRWATANGRRMDFIVDARTGAVLDVEGQ